MARPRNWTRCAMFRGFCYSAVQLVSRVLAKKGSILGVFFSDVAM